MNEDRRGSVPQDRPPRMYENRRASTQLLMYEDRRASFDSVDSKIGR